MSPGGVSGGSCWCPLSLLACSGVSCELGLPWPSLDFLQVSFLPALLLQSITSFEKAPNSWTFCYFFFCHCWCCFLEDFVCLHSYFSSCLSLESFSCTWRLTDSHLGCVQSAESWFFPLRFLFLAFLFYSLLQSLCSRYQLVFACWLHFLSEPRAHEKFQVACLPHGSSCPPLCCLPEPLTRPPHPALRTRGPSQPDPLLFWELLFGSLFQFDGSLVVSNLLKFEFLILLVILISKLYFQMC